MPFYSFKNKETEEVIEVFMSISKLDGYKEEHPELEVIIGTPKLIDPTRLDATRIKDSGFKEVLQKIHARTPGSCLDRTTNL
jgi:hypothetical protein